MMAERVRIMKTRHTMRTWDQNEDSEVDLRGEVGTKMW